MLPNTAMLNKFFYSDCTHTITDAVVTQPGDKSAGLPMPAGNMIDTAFPARGAPVKTRHLCVEARFIDKHQPPDIHTPLAFAP
jgi:hypothetical protein